MKWSSLLLFSFLTLFSSVVSQSDTVDPQPLFRVKSTNRDTILGHAYEYGEKVDIDLRKALVYYRNAARAGDAEAQYHLGYACQISDDKNLQREALELFSRASEQNHHEATYQLGRMYEFGKGVHPDIGKAISVYRRAAEWGHAASCTRMGEAYRKGSGVPQDFDEASRWLKKGVDDGDSLAMANLAYMYDSGEGVEKTNSVTAWYWFNEACYLHYRAYLAGRCDDVGMLHILEYKPQLLQTFKQRYRAEHGNEVNLGKEGEWRIQPALKPDDPKYWALATSALLVEMNEGQHTLLGTDLRDCETSRKRRAWTMFSFWGVGSRQDLARRLDWLENEGDRARYDRIVKALDRDKAGDPKLLAELLQSGMKYKIDIVRGEQDKWRGKSLLGFDYARYVTLCRWGYLVGYLNESEAWGKIMPAARKLKGTFSSWRDLAENYLVGRRFISASLTLDSGDEFKQSAEKMLGKYSNKPWGLCEWDMDLSEKQTRSSSK